MRSVVEGFVTGGRICSRWKCRENPKWVVGDSIGQKVRSSTEALLYYVVKSIFSGNWKEGNCGRSVKVYLGRLKTQLK